MVRKQVLIAGGGIGGLSAALGAARAGWDVRLFERAEAFSEVGAGIQMGPNVVRRLQAWGLHRQLQAVVALPKRLVIRSALTGEVIASRALGADMVARYGAAYATIHRADLHGVLLSALERYDEVHLNLGHAIEGFQQEEAVVTVRTSAKKIIEGDALVGADGLHSVVREQLLHDGPPPATGHFAYRALMHQAQLPKSLRTEDVTVWLGPDLHVIQYPIRRSELQNLVLIVNASVAGRRHVVGWDDAGHASELDQVMKGVSASLKDLIDAVPSSGADWRLWALHDRPAIASSTCMANGLVALLGDAAHPMRPYLAQGAGMAIEDAAELQRALSMHDLDVNLRLQRYALNRWQRNARVQSRSRRNGYIFHATGLVRWGRDLSMKVLGERLLDMPWLYRGDGSSASSL